MFKQSISKNSLILAAFALFTTGMIVLTATLTKPKIERDEALHLEQRLLEVLPQISLDQSLLDHVRLLGTDPLLGTKKPTTAYLGITSGEASGLVMKVVAPEGYGGSINLLVGIDPTGTITGVRVVPPHFETPGLGDAIDIKKSNWITQFKGKSLTNLSAADWAVKKDGGTFDAFTGATITPRAVVNAVHNALLYFKQHQQQLLTPEQTMPARQGDSHDS